MYYNISEQEIYLFHQGTNYHSHQLLGSQFIEIEGKKGFRFVVWAPNALEVQIIGDFNSWDGGNYALERLTKEGLWVGFFTDVQSEVPYKYKIVSVTGEVRLKADPYAVQSELRPNTASLTAGKSTYKWTDQNWLSKKKKYNPYTSPLSIYEVHLGSWKKKETGEYYTYKELADELIPYVKSLRFTHIELLPLAEHPFDLSWGYQITGYFSVTARYGKREDFKYFINKCHQHNIGVIMDWVPGHFCKDDFGLREFDGEPLYEYADPKKGEKRSWGTLTFDFGRPEVQSFLISNALFWLEEYHIDGIRVDAVASMLYLNFDRQEGEEKIYNSYGGEENLEAIAFLRKLNEVVFSYHPNALMMAEDSSDIPLITAPTYSGGLGFNFKWNMGWMNDMLSYIKKDPVHRKWHHNLVTFSFMYTYSENFLLPLSHDEVVHGKKSLLDKMPGDRWQQFANLRLLLGYMIAHPGKNLLFMGAELAQYAEWKDKEQLDWHLLDYPLHQGIFTYVKALNHFYLKQPQLYELDHDPKGFEWIDPHNIDQSIIAFRRKSKHPNIELIIVCNFTPTVRYDYKVGVPSPGKYQEIFNSDAKEYGGSGQLNEEEHFSFSEKWHGLPQHIKIKIPPLAMSVYKRIDDEESVD
ncbi:1,4-alpha-glucan branching protein GlgB [Oceanobacillus bengalensis]|uniref:1,4-alpha-glucan branching enzyme GlgB n=1 Tax=Oceanobacillus bengalensis TaxID=1435466 RepID=A0A494YU29_9BACI|nr:1,4-alpha-glucan branching protein GlgB [Oceanobacillus bengalensis]RKQ13654.1 1,4-alpha-glucan branching protein GlgB [Oceanobacillus bengalensis]